MGSRKVSLADKMKKVNEMQSQGVKKGQGVDAFFINEIEAVDVEDYNITTDIDGIEDTYMDTRTGTLPSTRTETNTITSINPITDRESMIDSLLSNNEKFIRCVAYLRKDQSDFIKDMSKQLTKKNKGKRIKESEIFRMAIDMLMEAVKK